MCTTTAGTVAGQPPAAEVDHCIGELTISPSGRPVRCPRNRGATVCIRKAVRPTLKNSIVSHFYVIIRVRGHKAALRLADRTGLAVEKWDVEALVDAGELPIESNKD
jgi:hypothetical protein